MIGINGWWKISIAGKLKVINCWCERREIRPEETHREECFVCQCIPLGKSPQGWLHCVNLSVISHME